MGFQHILKEDRSSLVVTDKCMRTVKKKRRKHDKERMEATKSGDGRRGSLLCFHGNYCLHAHAEG